MATYRVQIGFPMDSALPRDVVTITPHFIGSDPAALGQALKTNIIANPHVGSTVPWHLKVYDALKAKPSPPLFETGNGTGFSPAVLPPELALCLSYYATNNRPRFRGRLYIPLFLLGTTVAGKRPLPADMAAVKTWAVTLSTNLPASTNWALYSKKDGQTHNVTNYWVDDEWDVMRSRGLRGVTRDVGVV